MEDEALGGELYGGGAVGGGFGFDAGDGEEIFYGGGEAAVAVDPVFLEGADDLAMLASGGLRLTESDKW